MAEKSTIEWTNASWSPIRARNLKTGKIGWHCEYLTTGCEFCYAEGMNKRFGTGLQFKPGHRKDIEIFLDDNMLLAPFHWRKPRMIFVCSMTDLFADFVKNEWIDKIFSIMALAPQHTFQVLTKRADRMARYLGDVHVSTIGGGDICVRIADRCAEFKSIPFADCVTPSKIRYRLPLSNVWLGVSTERQQEADERIPLLLQTPAAVRFISAEPLIGPIDLACRQCGTYTDGHHIMCKSKNRTPLAGLNWAIVGGESGPHRRPMDLTWAYSLRDQCIAASVPFFMKQIDGKKSIPLDLQIRQFPDGVKR
jgi:protein gp37